LSLEGCSLLTTRGLESVITSWSDVQSLSVVSCKIKDEEISPALSELFPNLKELKRRPDNKSLLAASLVGTGMGKKGSVFQKGMKSDNLGAPLLATCFTWYLPRKIDLSCSRSYRPNRRSKERCSVIQQVSLLNGITSFECFTLLHPTMIFLGYGTNSLSD
jgi:hypothetical protein